MDYIAQPVQGCSGMQVAGGAVASSWHGVRDPEDAKACRLQARGLGHAEVKRWHLGGLQPLVRVQGRCSHAGGPWLALGSGMLVVSGLLRQCSCMQVACSGPRLDGCGLQGSCGPRRWPCKTQHTCQTLPSLDRRMPLLVPATLRLQTATA